MNSHRSSFHLLEENRSITEFSDYITPFFSFLCKYQVDSPQIYVDIKRMYVNIGYITSNNMNRIGSIGKQGELL